MVCHLDEETRCVLEKQILFKVVLRELPYPDCGDREQERPGSYKHNHLARGWRCEADESQGSQATSPKEDTRSGTSLPARESLCCARCKAQYVWENSEHHDRQV